MTAARHATIPLDHIADSPLNPRRSFDETKLAELAVSIGQKGVQQEVKVRPLPGDSFELVYGHRRVRAARLAGLTEIPAVVVELTDQEVLEEQLIENGQRDDVHPLDEADGFRQLHEDFKQSIEEIAAKVGKDKSYIYKRLKLCALGEEARESFLEGRISPAVAYMVARVPPELQVAALELTHDYEYRDGKQQLEALGAADVAARFRQKLMVELANAPFDLADANLVAGASACIACPKRTGNQPDLFGDVKGPNICTDPSCFKKKQDAGVKLRLGEAKKSGARVLTKEEAKKVWPYHSASSPNGFVELTQHCYDDPKVRTYQQLLGKDAPVVLARDPDGRLRELVDEKDLKKALANAGHNFAAERRQASTSTRSPSEKARAQKEALEQRVSAETRRRAMAAVVAEAEHIVNNDTELLAALIEAAISEVWSETMTKVCDRRGIEGKRGDRLGELRKRMETMSHLELAGLLVEVLLTRSSSHHMSTGGEFETVCKILKVDRKVIEKEIRTELAGGAKTKPAAAEPKPARGKRACVVPMCARSAKAKGFCVNHYGKARRLKMDPDKLSTANLRQLSQDGRRFEARA